jgi:transmembrane sensor
MNNKDAEELLRKYRAGACSEEERALLEQWYQEWNTGEPTPRPEELNAMREQTWHNLSVSQDTARTFPSWYRSIAAVLALTVLSVSAWLFVTSDSDKQIAAQVETPSSEKQDVLPGGNKAILSLADGTRISLTDVEEGKIAEEHGMAIRKTADGQILYEPAQQDTQHTNANDAGVVSYNQIATPRGGQYQLTLPDGTRVWLNAASSLRYPVQFSGSMRTVELDGEAYFEVNTIRSASGTRVPFIVSASNQTVEVLGTRFNINSYVDETSVSTTLLEGSVRVSVASRENRAEGVSRLLKPDQQSVLTGDHLQVREVNAEEMVAWMEGYFSFRRADIKTIMRDLSRWYDLDVVYEGEIPASTYSGKVDRNMNLSDVLEVLAFSDVNFRMEGKRIVIYP